MTVSPPLTHVTQQALWLLKGANGAQPPPAAAACDASPFPRVIFQLRLSKEDVEQFLSGTGSLDIPTCPDCCVLFDQALERRKT